MKISSRTLRFFKNALGGNTLKTKEFFCFFTTQGLDPPGFVPDIILSGRSAPRRRRLPAVHRKYEVFSLYRRKTPRLSLEREKLPLPEGKARVFQSVRALDRPSLHSSIGATM